MNKQAQSRVPAILALIAAAAMIIVGLLRSEHLVVLQKAVNICLECIGIG
ncbi:MAG: hypothetical protein GX572_00545 [Clostridia bacterium]|nr:hypothetical protein [Clostridia bacterium]